MTTMPMPNASACRRSLRRTARKARKAITTVLTV
jgi:hypothetical protein